MGRNDDDIFGDEGLSGADYDRLVEQLGDGADDLGFSLSSLVKAVTKPVAAVVATPFKAAANTVKATANLVAHPSLANVANLVTAPVSPAMSLARTVLTTPINVARSILPSSSSAPPAAPPDPITAPIPDDPSIDPNYVDPYAQSADPNAAYAQNYADPNAAYPDPYAAPSSTDPYASAAAPGGPQAPYYPPGHPMHRHGHHHHHHKGRDSRKHQLHKMMARRGFMHGDNLDLVLGLESSGAELDRQIESFGDDVGINLIPGRMASMLAAPTRMIQNSAAIQNRMSSTNRMSRGLSRGGFRGMPPRGFASPGFASPGFAAPGRRRRHHRAPPYGYGSPYDGYKPGSTPGLYDHVPGTDSDDSDFYDPNDDAMGSNKMVSQLGDLLGVDLSETAGWGRGGGGGGRGGMSRGAMQRGRSPRGGAQQGNRNSRSVRAAQMRQWMQQQQQQQMDPGGGGGDGGGYPDYGDGGGGYPDDSQDLPYGMPPPSPTIESFQGDVHTEAADSLIFGDAYNDAKDSLIFGDAYNDAKDSLIFGDVHTEAADSLVFGSDRGVHLSYDSSGKATIEDGDGDGDGGSFPAGRDPKPSFLGSEASPKNRVVAMQKKLRGIGFSDVKPSGKLDRVTVESINSVFNGWDDAPASYRGGNLTDRQIAANLGNVEKLLGKAVGGAQMMLNADKGE